MICNSASLINESLDRGQYVQWVFPHFYIGCIKPVNFIVRKFNDSNILLSIFLPSHISATSNLNHLAPIILVSKSPTQ